MVDEKRTVTVNGVGVALTPPDRALLSLSAEASGRDPGAALAACSAAASAMVGAALAAGVRQSAVQTNGLSLQPNWEHHRDEARLVGYVARSMLRLWVQDLEEVGSVLTAVVAAGGTAGRVDNVSLTVGDPTAALRSAREAAFADARAKAEQYAALAGGELGVLLSVQEDNREGHPQVWFAGRQAAAAPALANVEPGESRLAIHVSASWELLSREPVRPRAAARGPASRSRSGSESPAESGSDR